MTDANYPLKATLKAGQGYDAPWLTVDATDPHDLANKLQALGQAGVHEALVEAANLLKAANNAAPLAPQGQEAQPQQQYQSPWGAGAQQQAPAPQAPQQQGGGGGGGRGQQHPEGKPCAQCGTVLEFKTTGNGKKKWQCPQWRWNNGNPNGHDVEWING